MKTNVKGKDSTICPVCGYPDMPYPATSWKICPCCGTEFENDDRIHTAKELRQAWITADMPWFDDITSPPKNWNPYRQLIIAELGADLLLNPRIETDFNYRYAVDDAFSTVRIGAQLKVLRETRQIPLTQKQLADKAEMKQSRISELESMDYSSWSVSTLKRFAMSLGVRFMPSFESWGELVPEIAGGLSQEALWVPSFEEDAAFQKRAEILSARVQREEKAKQRIRAAAIPQVEPEIQGERSGRANPAKVLKFPKVTQEPSQSPLLGGKRSPKIPA